jgi:hypothetical protein
VRIAVRHEAMARAAAQAMQRPDADQSRLLEREAEVGMVSICAAAFALEALSRGTQPTGRNPAGHVGQVEGEEEEVRGPSG